MERPANRLGKNPSGASPGARRRPVVLAVDDQPDILASLRNAFKELLPGVTLLTASSAEAALRIVPSRRVDFLVVDFKMPDMDGIEFLQRARAIRPGIRSMMITGYPDPDVARRASLEGASLVIAKPFDLEVLVGAVDFMLTNADRPVGGSLVPRRPDPSRGTQGPEGPRR